MEILIGKLSEVCLSPAPLLISPQDGAAAIARSMNRPVLEFDRCLTVVQSEAASLLVDIESEGTLLEMLFVDLLMSTARATILNLGLSSTPAMASAWLCTTCLRPSQRL